MCFCLLNPSSLKTACLNTVESMEFVLDFLYGSCKKKTYNGLITHTLDPTDLLMEGVRVFNVKRDHDSIY
jgi:hypothetical protein